MTRIVAVAPVELGFLRRRGGTRLDSSPDHMPLFVGNVLIVEDDRETREMVRELLATEGFYALAAEDGLEGLHLLRAVRHRSPDAPCLILLDLAMPRLGGNEFRRSQLGDPSVANVPIAVMSGALDLEQRAKAMGAVATLPKPLDVDLLVEVVKRYCA